MSDLNPNQDVHLALLKLLENNPNASQRDLAKAAGISLGKLNYCLKALIKVGFVKAGNFAKSDNKKGYAYFVTPKGVAEKAKLAVWFLERKQQQYEKLKSEIEELKLEVQANSRDVEVD